MFEHIIAPLDGSLLAECVLPHVVAIARAYDSRVSLLRVLDPARAMTLPRSLDPFDWQMRKAEAEIYLRDIDLALELEGLHPRIEVLEGTAAMVVFKIQPYLAFG